MKEHIQVFDFADQQIRTLLIDNEPHFVATDVARVLGYARPNDAVSAHCRATAKHRITDSLGRKQEMTTIPERDLYRMIMRSQLPEAERFEEWVVGEVLPSIRRHGLYANEAIIEKVLMDPEFGIRLLKELKTEREKHQISQDTNRRLMHTEKTYTASELAKEAGFSSAKKLNELLHELRIQYKANGTWLPYYQYADKGLMEIKQEIIPGKTITYRSRWTQKGRAFILELIEKKQQQDKIQQDASAR